MNLLRNHGQLQRNYAYSCNKSLSGWIFNGFSLLESCLGYEAGSFANSRIFTWFQVAANDFKPVLVAQGTLWSFSHCCYTSMTYSVFRQLHICDGDWVPLVLLSLIFDNCACLVRTACLSLLCFRTLDREYFELSILRYPVIFY